MVELSVIYNLIMTVAIGLIGWSLRELYNSSGKRQDEAEKAIEELDHALNESVKDLNHVINDNAKELTRFISEEIKEINRRFVTKDQHDSDINGVERKIDGMMDILLQIKEDIGKLTGKDEMR